jgi:serine phosphatase RsbU (regulator of sigma subunit)
MQSGDSKTRSTGAAEKIGHAARSAETFWQRVTEGIELQDLWGQFKAEARSSYGLYSRDVDWEGIEQEKKRWKRPFRIAWALFKALLMKLSPARRVLLLLAMAMLMFSGESKFRGEIFTFKLEGLAAAILFLLLALELADRVTMKRDLEIAREIQRWLVPETPPQAPGVDIAFSTRPANTVAGDYYDAILRGRIDGQPQRLLLAVADVAGKSVPAAMLMATFQASFRALEGSGAEFSELVRGLNRYACANSLNGLRFTTAFLAQIDLSTHEMEYTSAGHNPPLLRRRSGATEKLEAGGLPLGIEPDEKYERGAARLGPGDLLVIYTDGVVEAVNEREEQFEEKRLLEIVAATPGGESAAATLARLTAAVDAFAGQARQHDDITCLILRVL